MRHPSVAAAANVKPRNLKGVDEESRFGSVHADHHEVVAVELVGRTEVGHHPLDTEVGIGVVDSGCQRRDLRTADVLSRVALMAQIGRFNDVG